MHLIAKALLTRGIVRTRGRKNSESYASAKSWLRTRISLDILRSVHTCVRGSRSPFHKNVDFLDDLSANARNADIFFLITFSGFVVDRIFYYFPLFLHERWLFLQFYSIVGSSGRRLTAQFNDRTLTRQSSKAVF